MNRRKSAIYPGTFDPITKGHLDIIERASKIFDEIIVAVAENSSKRPMFQIDERIAMVDKAVEQFPHVTVIGFNSLLVDLTDELDADVVIRGIRAVSDFEYEFQMGYANSSLKKELETIFLMPKLEYAFISSSIVRSILPFSSKELESRGKIEHLVPQCILEDVLKKLRKEKS
jgi:pantetheine-phosphate adenylyltransferase